MTLDFLTLLAGADFLATFFFATFFLTAGVVFFVALDFGLLTFRETFLVALRLVAFFFPFGFDFFEDRLEPPMPFFLFSFSFRLRIFSRSLRFFSCLWRYSSVRSFGMIIPISLLFGSLFTLYCIDLW